MFVVAAEMLGIAAEIVDEIVVVAAAGLLEMAVVVAGVFVSATALASLTLADIDSVVVVAAAAAAAVFVAVEAAAEFAMPFVAVAWAIWKIFVVELSLLLPQSLQQSSSYVF